jgi:hypothetical protein
MKSGTWNVGNNVTAVVPCLTHCSSLLLHYSQALQPEAKSKLTPVFTWICKLVTCSQFNTFDGNSSVPSKTPSNHKHLPNLSLCLYPMSFSCSFCNKNLCSQGGLTRHVNSKHNKNSALAGMAEASKLHTFKHHPYLSGMSKSVGNCL